jgi:hypothetical protein
MAALDFGMALAKGLISPVKQQQEETLKLAGGRNVFKSEDWWNKQLDRQIKSKVESPLTLQEWFVPSGYGGSWIRQQKDPAGRLSKSPQSYTQVREIQTTEQRYLNPEELSQITATAKRGAQQAKRMTAESQATKRRLARATGGLMGKARQPGDEPSTGLPALGEGGLGIVGSILGGGIKL